MDRRAQGVRRPSADTQPHLRRLRLELAAQLQEDRGPGGPRNRQRGNAQLKTTDEWMSWYNLVADRASDNLRARPEDIISAVCYLTRVRPEHLASKSRAQHISMAR